MVRRPHDDQRRPRGVRQREHPSRPSPGAQEHDPGAPQRPSHVQRRHRGQLVGQTAQPARCAGVAAPPAVPRCGGQRVDVLGEQPWRRHRQQQEADEPHGGPQHERVADLAVARRTLSVDPHQHGGRDHVVQKGVPVAAHQGQPRRRGDHRVRPALDIQAQRGLDVEQVPRVRGRGAQVGVGHQSGGAVGDVEHRDQRQLLCGHRAQTPDTGSRLGHVLETAARRVHGSSVIHPSPPWSRP